MISARMQNAKHDNLVAFEPVKQFVRKTPHHYSTKSTIIVRMKLRILEQTLNCGSGFGHKLLTQANSLVLVPISSLTQVRLSLRSDDDAPFHVSAIA
jgi:hypothetical protein